MPVGKKTRIPSKHTSQGGATAAGGFVFADPAPTPDDFTTFSKADILADSKIKGAEHLEPFPKSRTPETLALESVLGNAKVTQIKAAGKMVFHSVGDTGGIKRPEFQFAVADAMSNDLANKKAYADGQPAFFYHLGDVVYYLGQERYYYDQFYDPYRDYNAPIFAIPGNHDGMISPSLGFKSLAGFIDNFCTKIPKHNREAQGFARTTMTQPGVYFTLETPFAKIIGLYSNTSEGGTEGVISGRVVGMTQLTFLTKQLQSAADERAANDKTKTPNRALIIAVHHPAFTGSTEHAPSSNVLKDMDQACDAAKIQPDLVLSGHSHLYERYTRNVKGAQVPFVVAGMGGYFNLVGLKRQMSNAPKVPVPVPGTQEQDYQGNKVTLEAYDDVTFGFLRLTVSNASIKGTFVTVDTTRKVVGEKDPFTIDLRNNTVTNG